MNLKRKDLEAAASAGVLLPEQIDPLLAFFSQRDALSGKARFSGSHVFYYLGGILAIGAGSIFTTLAVEAFGMATLFVLSTLYAVLAVLMAAWLERRGLGVPAGIFATLAIALTPLAVFALQHRLGFWSSGSNAQHYRDYHMWIDWRWLVMELATLLAGALMLKRFRYSFLVMPLGVTLWYMGMDIIPALIMQADVIGMGGEAGWVLRKQISLAFGLVMLLFAFFVDLRSRHSKDYAFWLYLFGLLSFWGALSSMDGGKLSGKLIYLAINFGLIFFGAMIGRKMFAVFGGIGAMMALGNLAWDYFKDSFAFVLVLTALGFVLIAAGWWWGRHEAAISARLRAVLPRDLRELLEART